jgi:hypothetical protein
MITLVVSRLFHAAQRAIAHARALFAHTSPITPPGYDASASYASEHAYTPWILYVR